MNRYHREATRTHTCVMHTRTHVHKHAQTPAPTRTENAKKTNQFLQQINCARDREPLRGAEPALDGAGVVGTRTQAATQRAKPGADGGFQCPHRRVGCHRRTALVWDADRDRNGAERRLQSSTFLSIFTETQNCSKRKKITKDSNQRNYKKDEAGAEEKLVDLRRFKKQTYLVWILI